MFSQRDSFFGVCKKWLSPVSKPMSWGRNLVCASETAGDEGMIQVIMLKSALGDPAVVPFSTGFKLG